MRSKRISALDTLTTPSFRDLRSQNGESQNVPSCIPGREGAKSSSQHQFEQRTRPQQEARAAGSDSRRELLLGQADAVTHANDDRARFRRNSAWNRRMV